MLGCEMGRFLFGVFAGSTLCLLVFSSVADGALKESVRNGWMVIDGVPYEINKSSWIDVVNLKKYSCIGDWRDDASSQVSQD